MHESKSSPHCQRCQNFIDAFSDYALLHAVKLYRLSVDIAPNIPVLPCLDHEAMLHEEADLYRPRSFKVIIDHHRLEVDNYGRERDTTEWAHEVLKTLAHELVHVKQYVMGELSMRRAGLCYRGVHHVVDTLTEYFELPYEIEAYGREKGLLISFLAFWKSISEEFDFSS